MEEYSDDNITKTEYVPDDSSSVIIYLSILAAASIISLIANGAISLMICSFRRLRKKKYNIIILHWSILSGTYLVLEPSSLRLGLDIENTGVSEIVFCVIEEVENAIAMTIMFFVLFITIYWYYQFHHQEKLKKLEENFNYILIIIYLVASFCLVIQIEGCINKRYIEGFSTIMITLMFIGYIILMVLVNIVHEIKRRIFYNNVEPIKNNSIYYLSNAYLMCNLPLIISILIIPIYTSSDVLIFIFGLISYLNPVYNLIILYNFDNDFNLFFKHVLRCKTNDYPEEFDPELTNVDHRF